MRFLPKVPSSLKKKSDSLFRQRFSLKKRKGLGQTGFEPATTTLSAWRSTRLSHWPIIEKIRNTFALKVFYHGKLVPVTCWAVPKTLDRVSRELDIKFVKKVMASCKNDKSSPGISTLPITGKKANIT